MRLSRNLLYGTLFGVLFPVGATLLTANNIPITNLSSLIDLHRQTPLLLIIDTASFFLGVFAAFGAYQLDRQFETQEGAHGADELRTLIDTANAPIFGIDTSGLVNEWNQTAERITGYSKSEVMGRDLVESFITEDYKVSVKGVLDEALKGRETANYAFPLYSKTNARVDVLLNSTTRRDSQGGVVGVVGVGQDVTELNSAQKEFERKLTSAANYDVLTGLPNRCYFYDYLAGQLEIHQGSDEIGTLLFLDLDRFKLVNDSLGHSIGDQLLKVVSKRLQASVRAGDLVCRLGGDEFIVLLPLEGVVLNRPTNGLKK